MKSNLLRKRLVGAILGLCLLVGIGIASSATAQAQWPNDRDWQREQIRRQRQMEREQMRREREAIQNQSDYRYDDWRYGNSQLRQTALNAGYNEGIKEGRKDRQRGERFEYRDEADYQNATIDYSSHLGNRELYRMYFRQGFANGYNDGYRGY
jgi:hypothetical protein